MMTVAGSGLIQSTAYWNRTALMQQGLERLTTTPGIWMSSSQADYMLTSDVLPFAFSMLTV